MSRNHENIVEEIVILIIFLSVSIGANTFTNFSDYGGEFNCEIEKDGKVLIRGVTSTGGRTVSSYSRVFDMKIQQQCP
ncbi:hypothetical protein KY284_021828 [Solanum tuberosum]|nr:hypothetical protein KY284_021828 [Solanum tuberosum]